MKKPSDIPLSYLLSITNYFSDKQMLGSGGYGEVYKGVLDDGSMIAVKKLFDMAALDDNQFKNEFNNLVRVNHRNIVRLIGYCDEARSVIIDVNGENRLAKIVFKVLCFEYLPRGSLENYLSEEHDGMDWHGRYNIIKGICEGLDYLHGGLKEPIFHLDLKPENILFGMDMVPKIADFGLSRLFNGTHTHTTKIQKGTVNYMPPEFLEKRQISHKYDVFSLGIIIMQIMAGRQGFTKYAKISSSPEQFVELVLKNWKQRIGSTEKYTEEDCLQVRRCLEIALSCVEPERAKRPSISDIVRELRKTETNGTGSSWDKGKVAKIGNWGGVGGGYNDIEIAPQRLESLTIQSGEVIYSLEFSFSDHFGQKHTAGPWGGYGPNNGIRYDHTIKLGPTEFMLEVSGTIGPFDIAPAGVITSLTFTTNTSTYGPFGQVRGTSFQVPVQGNGSIVAFFARTGWYVDAFGIYVKPEQETTKGEEEVGVVKIGPWGGDGGIPRDIKVAPQRLDSVTIRSDVVVDSLEFSYHGQDGQKHTIGPWGGTGGSSCLIELGPSEFLMGAYGTRGPFTNSLADVVTSLALVTNARSYGPFGQGGGKPFQVPMQGSSSIVGFFGCTGSYVEAIGVYVNTDDQQQHKAMEQEAGLTKIGPWGGTGGTAHDMDKKPEPHRLQSITIRCGEVIDSITFSYVDQSGNPQTIGPWGGSGGSDSLIRLKPLEFVQGISGTFGPFGASANVITSLTIATSQGRGYGPYGQGGGTPFNLPVGSDSCIVGFFGRTGSYLEAIGAYVQTYCPVKPVVYD